MKLIFSFLFVLCINAISFAQLSNDSLGKVTNKPTIGINLITFRTAVLPFSVSPLITLSWEKYSLFFGPKFLIDDGYSNLSVSGRYKIFGVMGGLQYYPNGKGKTFDFYFQAMAIYTSFRRNFNYTSSPSYIQYHAIEPIIGYGFNWNVFNNFFISQSGGIGPALVNYKYSFLEHSDNVFLDSYYFSIGAGYFFGKR
jgi:hypothetical protein